MIDDRIEEKDLKLPALFLIEQKGGISTSELIDELTEIFQPKGEDAKILESRSDTKFSQKVRNLVGSHRKTNGMSKLVKRKDGKMYLTDKGFLYLQLNKDNIEELLSGRYLVKDFVDPIKQMTETRISVCQEEYGNTVVAEGKRFEKRTLGRIRSAELRKKAIDYYSDRNGRIRCAVCGFDFEDHYGARGKDYIEVHHEIPICTYDDEGKTEFLDAAIKNVKPLCANCHRMIHRDYSNQLSVEELKKIYKK